MEKKFSIKVLLFLLPPLILVLAVGVTSLGRRQSSFHYKAVNYDYSKAKVVNKGNFKALWKKIEAANEPLAFLSDGPPDSVAGWIEAFKNFVLMPKEKSYHGCHSAKGEYFYGKAVTLIWDHGVDGSSAVPIRNLSMVRNCRFESLVINCPKVSNYSFLQYNDLRQSELYVFLRDLRHAAVFDYISCKKKVIMIDQQNCAGLDLLKQCAADGFCVKYVKSNILELLPADIITLSLNRHSGERIINLQQLAALPKLEELSLRALNSAQATLDLSMLPLKRVSIIYLEKLEQLTLPAQLEVLWIKWTACTLKRKVKVKYCSINQKHPALLKELLDKIEAEKLWLTVTTKEELDIVLRHKFPEQTRLYLEIKNIDPDFAALRKLPLEQLHVWSNAAEAERLKSGAKNIINNFKPVKGKATYFLFFMF